MELSGRGPVGASVGNQGVLDKEGDFKHRSRFGTITKSEGGQVLGGDPDFGVAGCARGQREFHPLLGVGKSVLPTPRSHSSVFPAPFVALVEVEIQAWTGRVLATKHVHGEVFDVPSGEVAHVAIGRENRNHSGLHSHGVLVNLRDVRQAHVHPSIVGMVADLHLSIGHRAR